MAKKSEMAFNNDWESAIEEPERVAAGKTFEREGPDPYYQKREDTYYYMMPDGTNPQFAFALVPAADGTPFLMTDLATIKLWKFAGKDGTNYFDTIKMPMDPEVLFDMEIQKKVLKGETPTEKEKKVLAQIKRHGDLIQRYKDLQYCKVEGVNFGWAPKPTKFSGRIKKSALTLFFGTWTLWKGAENTLNDRGIKLFVCTYVDYQKKFRDLVSQFAKTHQKLQPSWFEDYFSAKGEVKGILLSTIGDMKVGGNGASVKMIKVGKDPIDDASVGITGPILESDLVLPTEPENRLSHIHYLMGIKSTEDKFQDLNADRFEEAIEQLESHVNERKILNASAAAVTAKPEGSNNKPF